MKRQVVRTALRLGALLVGVLALQLLFPGLAFARGGGGGHGGGGGGGGGSFGGGGGGGFGGGGGGGFGGGGGGLGSVGAISGVGLLVLFGVGGLVLFVLLMYLRSRANQPYVPRYGGTNAGPATMPGVQEGAAAIHEADPGFEPESFLQKAEMAYLLVQRAYQDRNMHLARAFMSPQMWAQWSQNVEDLVQKHQRPVLENLNVRGMDVESVSHSESGDSVQIHFDVVAAVHYNDESSGQFLSGSKDDQRYAELWEFWRAPGAQTPASGGATASRCPNCGGLLKLRDDGRCDYCGADISSGKYDWVVTGMSPAMFKGVRTADALELDQLDAATGFEVIKSADPAFDEGAFRKRVEQAFFTLQKAWQERDLELSRPFMSPGLYLGWSSQVQQLIELHKKNVLDGLRIDDLQTDTIVHGQVYDTITTRITATCADYEVDERTGKIIFGSRQPSSFTEYWTFQRSLGAKTTGRSVLDKVCPNCGAPLEINQVGECRYCKAAVTSGQFDWVLSRIEQADSW